HGLVPVDRKLAGQRDDRRPVEIRVGDAGDEIRRTGTERREACAWHTGAAGHRLGHERGTRLVAREDELKAGLVKALDEIDDLPTRVAEDVADARRVEPVADDASDR